MNDRKRTGSPSNSHFEWDGKTRFFPFMTLGRGLDFWTFPYLCVLSCSQNCSLFKSNYFVCWLGLTLCWGVAHAESFKAFMISSKYETAIDCVQWSTHPQHLTCQSFPHAFQVQKQTLKAAGLAEVSSEAFGLRRTDGNSRPAAPWWVLNQPCAVVVLIPWGMMPRDDPPHRYGLQLVAIKNISKTLSSDNLTLEQDQRIR